VGCLKFTSESLAKLKQRTDFNACRATDGSEGDMHGTGKGMLCLFRSGFTKGDIG
jgi:hypothetical protein